MRIALVLAAAGLCLTSPASAQLGDQREAWNRPTEPFRIAANVHYVGTEALGAFLVTTPDGHILIDGALPESVDQIAGNIRRLGFRVEDVKYLLISHAHLDHAGGLAGLKALSGAKLLASTGDRPELESGKVAYRETWDFPAVKVDRVVRDGERFRLGGTIMTAHVTPGHTKGCTSWSARVEQDKRPIDVIFACSLTVAGQPLVGDAGYPSAAGDFRQSFAKLKRLTADVYVTFHTGFFDMEEKRARLAAGDAGAFIDPAELQRRVAAAEAAFEKEYARQRGGVEP
jgi:metallo-beta-lactamase class B